MILTDALDGTIDQAQTEVAHDPGARFPNFADWAKRLPRTFTVSQKVVEAESVSNGAISTRGQLEEWLMGNGFNVERMKNGVYRAVRNIDGEVDQEATTEATRLA